MVVSALVSVVVRGLAEVLRIRVLLLEPRVLVSPNYIALVGRHDGCFMARLHLFSSDVGPEIFESHAPIIT